MICYASNTGTRRNLAALLAAGWRILVAPAKPLPPAGFRYCLDNGAWSCWIRQVEFDAAAFSRLVDRHGAAADFVVAPDIVAGGQRSLDFTLAWLPRLQGLQRVLVPVQDGMSQADVESALQGWPEAGIFLGGTTEWKLATMGAWGDFAARHGRYYHVGRVNTARRIRLAAEAGAHSIDGSSASRFASTLPLLDGARRQPSLYAPSRAARP